MDLNNKNIAFFIAMKCEYGGNLFLMLKTLARILKDKFSSNVYFVLPKQNISGWHEVIRNEFELVFIEAPYNNCSHEILKFITEKKIDLIHSHFEAYDISISKAVKRSRRNVKQVWHLHDAINIDLSGRNYIFLRKLIRNYRNWRHYGYYGKNIYLLGVSAEILSIIEQFKDSKLIKYPKLLSNEELSNANFKYGEVLINGIDTSRLPEGYKRPTGVFTFFSFGGRVKGKGIPVILDACEILEKQNYKFKMLITTNMKVDMYVKERYGHNLPEWLMLEKQTDNIASLFSQSHCYISASLYETMSMAIAEASIYGLPVIQNDLPGTFWNTDTPSAFVFEKNNVDQLVVKMKQVMAMDPYELEQKCQISSSMNRERLALNKWVEAVIKVYQKI